MRGQIVFLVCVSVAFLCWGCGEIEDTEEESRLATYHPPLNAPEPDKTLLRLKDEDWEKLKGEDWIALTEEEIEELRNLEVPQRWAFETEDPKLFQKYRAAIFFQRFGDIPAVRYVVEYLQQPRVDAFVEVDLLSLEWMRSVAFHEASYVLFPNAVNRRTVQELWKQVEDERERRFLSQLRVEDPEAWVERKHASLIHRHGDIPEVGIIIEFLRKVELRLPITNEECITYIKVYDGLYDHTNVASEYEYYALQEAFHQLSLHQLVILMGPNDRLEKYRDARAAGISFDDIDWDDN